MNRLNQIVVVVIAFLFAFAAQANPVLRIMPMGDSITYGSGSTATAGYRAPLWTALRAAGYDVDYVGTQTGNQPTGVEGFDPDHEGYPGWRVSHETKGLLEQLDNVFATVRDPHVVLLMIGTNDTGESLDHMQNIMVYYEKLVDKICTAQPDARLVVSTITWRGDDANRDSLNQTCFNSKIGDFVLAQQAKGRHVSLVDMRAALGSDLKYFEDNDLPTVTDKLHPNATGYAKMAETWKNEIVRLFPDPAQVPAENAPAVVRAAASIDKDRPRLVLDFNQPVSASTVSSASNYDLAGGKFGEATVTAYSERSVSLAWNKVASGRRLNLVISGVQNASGVKTVAEQAVAVKIPGNSFVWETPKNICGDSDVVTEGKLVFASTQSKTAPTVNGVPFVSWWGVGGFPSGYQVPRLEVVGFSSSNWYDGFCAAGNPLLPGMSESYRQLVNSGVWDGGNSTKSLVIRDLVPGHEYLVQIWASDNRGRSDINYWLVLDDQVNLYYCENGTRSFGQYAIGRMKATETKATIYLRSETTSSTRSTMYTSVQVRDITQSEVAWEGPKTIYDDSDVRTDGQLVFAYNGSPTRSFAVNGVSFRRVLKNCIAIRNKADIQASGSDKTPSPYDGAGSPINANATYPASATDAYKGMLQNLMFANGTPNDWTITLKGLTPGVRYLVQLFFNDSRKTVAESASRALAYQLVDGQYELDCQNFDNGRRGAHITGTFTARGQTQSFTMCGRTRTTGYSNASLVGIQVRRLSDVLANQWNGYEYGVDAEDVVAVGTSVYACTPAASDLTVNGVTFATQGSSYNSWANGNIAIAGMKHRETTPYMNGYTTPDIGSYKDLLAAGLWSSRSECPSLTSELTISGLKECSQYLVQMWVNDVREAKAGSNRPGDDRTVTFGAWDPIPYRGITDLYPGRLGPVGYAYLVTGRGQTSVRLTTEYGVVSTAKNDPSPQINALQVRELSQESGTRPQLWNGYGAPWNDPIQGLRATALLPDGGEIALTGDASIGSVNAGAPVSITGADKKIYVGGAIDAPTCTVTAVWANRSASVCRDSLLSLQGDVEALRQIVASCGTIEYNPTTVPSWGVDLALVNGGTLVVSKPLEVCSVVPNASGTVEISGSDACMTVGDGLDLSGIVINFNENIGNRKTFLIVKGTLAAEPDVRIPANYRLRKRTLASGDTAWTISNGGLIIVVK